MGSGLPVELYIHILRQLPSQEQATLKTVLSFLSVSTVTRVAALDNLVWQNLYRAQYPHPLTEKEKERYKDPSSS